MGSCASTVERVSIPGGCTGTDLHHPTNKCPHCKSRNLQAFREKQNGQINASEHKIHCFNCGGVWRCDCAIG